MIVNNAVLPIKDGFQKWDSVFFYLWKYYINRSADLTSCTCPRFVGKKVWVCFDASVQEHGLQLLGHWYFNYCRDKLRSTRSN